MSYSYDRTAAVDSKKFLRKLLGDAEKDLKVYMAEKGVTGSGVVVQFETPPPRGGYGPFEVGKLWALGLDIRVVVDVPTEKVSMGANSGPHSLNSLSSSGTTRDAPARLKKILVFFKEKVDQLAASKAKAPTEEETGVWSVVVTGENHGYATEVDVFKSKADAERAARNRGNCYVVKGTQMWNEPLGQVEEHDRMAPSKYFR